ncbi:MAG: Gfo/Idh/MocA family protein [Gammaproteobacteria bacterium]
MGIVNIAVIGAGYLGKFHAQKYAALDNCQLTGLVDSDPTTVEEMANLYPEAKVSTDFLTIIDHVDAVSIVTSTPSHYEIAKQFLSRGKHVLLEKPMTSTTEQAKELIKIANDHGCILQIGHIERFNPTVLAMDEHMQQPKFIESQRLSPFKARGTDVNVVLDLMIHDIDIILSIVQSDIKSIQASGMSVLSDDIDIANARITFANDCVANVTASRVSTKSERKVRLFQGNAYFSADLGNHELKIYTRENSEINAQSFNFEKSDALLSEITHFLECINNNTQPLVSGIDGLRALHTANQIANTIQLHNAK